MDEGIGIWITMNAKDEVAFTLLIVTIVGVKNFADFPGKVLLKATFKKHLIISSGARVLVVFMLQVNLRLRGFTSSSLEALTLGLAGGFC